MIAVVDVIVPLHRQGAVVGGIEAEINLLETMRLIKATDDAYETEITRMLSVNAIILFAMLWWMIHHLLVRRVNQYDQVTRKIAAGEFSSRIASPMAQDELGRLGQSVNYMAESIEQLLHEQEESYLQMLRSLAKALETKDAYTATHSSRVSKYAFRLGQHLGLPAKKLALLKKGALMHDLGKIGIADAILNKPGPLTDDEFAIMKSHPVKTAAIMRPLTRFKEFAEIAAWHHERWDGKGYPDGLQGEAVPLLARVVSIADTWDAMTGDRVYRKGMPETKALSIMEREQDDGQWDPTLIRAFIAMVKEEQTATESQADPT
jgi:HD-GYP domain-containing protein (c-di-GMP phosphodiesterase class II)